MATFTTPPAVDHVKFDLSAVHVMGLISVGLKLFVDLEHFSNVKSWLSKWNRSIIMLKGYEWTVIWGNHDVWLTNYRKKEIWLHSYLSWPTLPSKLCCMEPIRVHIFQAHFTLHSLSTAGWGPSCLPCIIITLSLRTNFIGSSFSASNPCALVGLAEDYMTSGRGQT